MGKRKGKKGTVIRILKLKRTPPIPEIYNEVHWLKLKLAAISGGVRCVLCTSACTSPTFLEYLLNHL